MTRSNKRAQTSCKKKHGLLLHPAALARASSSCRITTITTNLLPALCSGVGGPPSTAHSLTQGSCSPSSGIEREDGAASRHALLLRAHKQPPPLAAVSAHPLITSASLLLGSSHVLVGVLNPTAGGSEQVFGGCRLGCKWLESPRLLRGWSTSPMEKG